MSPPQDAATGLSVVVPTLDEADRIEATLRAARVALGEEAELVVVDGGSRDDTRERARPLARVLRSATGRGRQLNRGARAARGEVLLFLHADTLLEPGAGDALRKALERPDVVGGCFRFALDPPPGRSLRFTLLEAGVRLRTRLFRTATGDQAIFATRRAFEAVGGFPELPLFEDVEFVRRLRGLGRFLPLAPRAFTSRRRWEREGFWRTVLVHWLLRGGYLLGVPPSRLARFYGRGEGPPGGPTGRRRVRGLDGR